MLFLWNWCESICAAALLRLAVLDKLVCPVPDNTHLHMCYLFWFCVLGLISALSSVHFVTFKVAGRTGNTGWLLTHAGPSPSPAWEVRWKTLQQGAGEARDVSFRIGVNVSIKTVCQRSWKQSFYLFFIFLS